MSTRVSSVAQRANLILARPCKYLGIGLADASLMEGWAASRSGTLWHSSNMAADSGQKLLENMGGGTNFNYGEAGI